MKIPLDRKSEYYLNAIQRFIDRHVTRSVSQSFREWANEATDLKTNLRDPLEITLPKGSPTVVSTSLKSVKSSNAELHISKSRLAEITPLVEGTDQQTVSYKEKRKGSSVSRDPILLEEKVGGTKFTVNNLIHAIVNNHPFSQRIDVPDGQVKLLLFYAFMRKKMITMNIEKEIMRHNIYYNYTRTGRLLREMAEQGLVEVEERVAKKSGFRYYLWKFTCGDDPKKSK